MKFASLKKDVKEGSVLLHGIISSVTRGRLKIEFYSEARSQWWRIYTESLKETGARSSGYNL